MHYQQKWIASKGDDLKLEIVVEEHWGEQGHRAYNNKIKIIERTYWWHEIKRDVKETIQACIQCIISRNGEELPRPLTTALNGEEP